MIAGKRSAIKGAFALKSTTCPIDIILKPLCNYALHRWPWNKF
jgi:hypothetical protein